MSPGLIMKITGVNDLGVIYAGDAWNDGNLRTLGSYTTMEGREALAHFLRLARALGCSPLWVVGGTKKEARALGLEHRLRAPGAGRRRLAPDQKRVQRTYWLSPECAMAIATAADASGRTLGEEIESRYLRA